MQNLTMTGRLVKEPREYAKGEKTFVFFRIAENSKKDDPKFFDFGCQGNTARFLKNYAHKGDFLVVQFQMDVKKDMKYKDEKGYSPEVISLWARNVDLCRGNGSNEGHAKKNEGVSADDINLDAMNLDLDDSFNDVNY